MDIINQDLGNVMLGQKQRGDSILDILGADSDTSFDAPIRFEVVQDTYHLSVGGQEIGQNANIQIQLDDDNCIHYMHKYALIGEITVVGGISENLLSCFDGTELLYSSVGQSFTFQKYYAQQKLAKMGKKQLEKYARGLLVKHDNFANMPTADYADQFIGLDATHNDAASTTDLQLYCRQLVRHFQQQQVVQAGPVTTTKFAVPLCLIFPTLQFLPDNGALLTAIGQKLKFNIRTTMASECISKNIIVGDPVVAPSYTLKNMQLARFYTKLDPNRADLILKSSILLPKLHYVHWQQNQVTPVINAIYPISSKDRIKSLCFSFNYNKNSIAGDDLVNIPANLINATGALYKCPLHYYPNLPIMQIDINIGGYTQTINMNQVQFLELSNSFSDQQETYNFPVQRQLKCAYVIDLTRFGYDEDAYGSSSKAITSCTVQITLKDGTRSLTGQPADWNGALFANFAFFSYLEVQQMMELRNGIYYNV